MTTYTIQLRYLGDQRVQATHVPTDTIIFTDAPKDNCGLGRSFSPTDLLATSVASCAVTVASLLATESGVEIGEFTVNVRKIMTTLPRRLARLDLTVYAPNGMPENALKVLTERIRDTPVARSLASEIEIQVYLSESGKLSTTPAAKIRSQ